jgi:hypothetical protein
VISNTLGELIWGIAKDANISALPKSMFKGGVAIEYKLMPDKFASHLDSKITSLLSEVSIDDHVYNGEWKVHAISSFFMDKTTVKECIASLIIKNFECFDCIPKRVTRRWSRVSFRGFNSLIQTNL